MRVEDKDGTVLRRGPKISLKAEGPKVSLSKRRQNVIFIFADHVKVGGHIHFEKGDIIQFTENGYILNENDNAENDNEKPNCIQGFFRKWKKQKVLVPYKKEDDDENDEKEDK